MNIEKLNLAEQEKVAKSEKEPTFEPLCGRCGEQLYKVGLNYKQKQIWRCENKKCGREGAGVVIEEKV